MAKSKSRAPRSLRLRPPLDEALRSRRFPGVIFVDGPAGRRAHLAGTGLDVWEVVELVREYGSQEAVMRAFPRLSPVRIRTAMAFAEEYPDEIQGLLDLNAREPEVLRRDYRHVETAGR
jgi:uncharacterized protein (DUF433 family)